MRFGQAIEDSIAQLRRNVDRLQDRGDPCGLLLGVDEPVGYQHIIPDQFRPFLSWGVDGVHDGLWIDDPNQAHPPHVVMASPMDFAEPIRMEATNVKEFLHLVEQGLESPEWTEAALRAVETRASLGLPPIAGYAIP